MKKHTLLFCCTLLSFGMYNVTSGVIFSPNEYSINANPNDCKSEWIRGAFIGRGYVDVSYISHYYDDASKPVYRITLCEDLEIRIAPDRDYLTFKNGTKLTFHFSGYVKKGTLAESAQIQEGDESIRLSANRRYHFDTQGRVWL